MTAIIAELGLTHEGSLGNALRMVDCAASCGATHVKFQCHDGDPVFQFRPGTEFPQDKCRLDYWDRTAFSGEQWQRLVDHAHNNNLKFGASVFSQKALANMRALKGLDFLKIGSGQTADTLLIREAAKSGLPLYISTGMSDSGEVWRAAEAASLERCGPLTLMHCTSKYPTAPEEVGLEYMDRLYGHSAEVGLSDHSGTVWPAVLAAFQGAAAVEVHLALSQWSFGPDVPASLTPDAFKQMVQGIAFVKRMRNATPRKEVVSEMEQMRKLFRPIGPSDLAQAAQLNAPITADMQKICGHRNSAKAGGT